MTSLPEGPFALVSHVGPYLTLTDAMPKIYEQAMALPDFEVVGLPALEIYHANEMMEGRAIEQTDVYLPIQATAASKPGR